MTHSLALGIILEVCGVTIEHATWFRKQNNFAHINEGYQPDHKMGTAKNLSEN